MYISLSKLKPKLFRATFFLDRTSSMDFHGGTSFDVITGLLKVIKVTGNGETATKQQNLPLTKPKDTRFSDVEFDVRYFIYPKERNAKIRV